jgi:hypothetical protein
MILSTIGAALALVRLRIRACRHSFEGKKGGDEVDCGGEAGVGFVVAGSDAAKLFEALEEVLDQVAPFVDLGVVRDGRFAIYLGRDLGGGAPVVQGGAQGVVVEGLVGDERAERDAVEALDGS